MAGHGLASRQGGPCSLAGLRMGFMSPTQHRLDPSKARIEEKTGHVLQYGIPGLTSQWSGRPTAPAFFAVTRACTCGPPLTGGVLGRCDGKQRNGLPYQRKLLQHEKKANTGKSSGSLTRRRLGILRE
jgi:hypothetical protein